MNRKGQAAMEFLMTYGWAIIIVLAAIGALAYFGVLSPQKLLPDRTVFPAPLPNVDNAVISLSDQTVAIAFMNNKGVDISIPGVSNFNISNPSSGASCVAMTSSKNPTIANGDSFILTWACTFTGQSVGKKFKADVSFKYLNTETNQNLTQTGSIEGKFG